VKIVFLGVMRDPVALSSNEARYELEKQFKEMIQELHCIEKQKENHQIEMLSIIGGHFGTLLTFDSLLWMNLKCLTTFRSPLEPDV